MTLYLTLCAVESDGVLVPVGDPHVFVVSDADWHFDPPVIRGKMITAEVHRTGTHHMVMALGFRPYDHYFGVCEVGTHEFTRRGQLCVTPSITVVPDNREVMIRRPPKELEVPRKEIAAPRRRIGWRRMLT